MHRASRTTGEIDYFRLTTAVLRRGSCAQTPQFCAACLPNGASSSWLDKGVPGTI
jgi:hypothetical protein